MCFVTSIFFPLSVHASETKTIIDMRGQEVVLPVELQRVATVDDGFVEGVMTHLGVIDKVVAIASWSMKVDYQYGFETVSGEKYEHCGLNTMKFLHPWLNDLPIYNSRQGNALNFETLALANPDVVILRVGDCALNDRVGGASEKAISTLEAMGFPVVVLYAPKGAELASMKEEMRVIGDIFNQEDKALALADKLAQTEQFVRDRTRSIAEADKKTVLYIGLRPDVRKQGGAGLGYGLNTPESYIIEEIANAKNAFRGIGSGVILNAEQVYALDPDVIILPTNNGYHPPRELIEAPYFTVLSELRAIKESAVYAMPWTPMNCARRVEYPLDMLIVAKAAYPDVFADVNVYDFALQFYQEDYGIDEATAKGMRSTQLLDWMADNGF